ncbi:MAG: SIR2 family protein [Sedimentisphaerales bacterium]|jgi:hypothetical protein
MPETPSRIIDLIKECTKRGQGIVPLIGSGMSVASGIPAGSDYRAYLFYCLARVFGTDGKGNKKERWNPSTLRWPDYSEVPIYGDIKKTMLQWSTAAINKMEKEDRYDEAEWEAIGAVADWRAMLDLLSRLSLGEGELDRKVILKYPDHSIIDSFFVNLTKGKQPNSSHLLLAHLSDILRLKIILTTNFDNLIENAFQSFVNPVTVFDVHMDANLPDADFVRAQRSVVKMHGGRYGLRADFSLDKYPTTDDVEKFVAYLSFYRNKNYPPLMENERNLLVMGISPETKRIAALICRAMTKLKDLEVYWICYREKDVYEVTKEFKQTFKGLARSGESHIKDVDIDKYLATHLLATSVSDLSLFLLELYQAIFLSLPPARVEFPSLWPLPPKLRENVLCGFREKEAELKEKIEKSDSNRFIYIYGKNGVVPMASAVFYELSNQYNCIWVNLDDAFDQTDFVFTIIELIAKKAGLPNVVPPNIQYGQGKVPPELIRQFKLILNRSKKDLLIFVSGRELSKKNEKESQQILMEVGSLLSHDMQSNRVTYILLGWPEKIAGCHCVSLEIPKHIAKKMNTVKLMNSKIIGKRLHIKLPQLSNEKHIDYFYKFAYSLTFVQNTSYLSLLHTWAFIKAPYPLTTKENKDNDEIRFCMARIYLSILRECNAIRDEEGHGVFMPQLISERVRNEIEKSNLINDIDIYKAECHQGIADWYMKLYRTSSDIQAVIDSIYHRLQCFQSAMDIKDPHNKERFLITSLIETELAIKLTYNTIYSSSHTLTLINSVKNIEVKISAFITRRNEIKDNSIAERCTKMLDNIEKELKDFRQDYLDYIAYGKYGGDKYIPLGPSKEICEICKKLDYDEAHRKLDLDEAIKHTRARRYTLAEKLFKDKIFKKIEFPLEKLCPMTKPDEIREVVRNWVTNNVLHKNVSELRCDQDTLKFAVKALRRYQALELYFAQIKWYLAQLKRQTGREDTYNLPNEVIVDLKNAEKIYIFSTEIMRYITDNAFLNNENAFLRSITGVILSKMKRHHEAYRRYNEAYRYLNFGIRPDEPLEFAVIDLRRGETFLSQIEQKLYNEGEDIPVSPACNKELPPSLKRHIGMLYDAIASVDRGELRMKDTVNTWRHCWMLELQLNLCVEIVTLRKKICETLGYNSSDKYDLFGHCRGCESCGNRFITNLKTGLEIAGNDVLRIARYLHLSSKYKEELASNFRNETLDRFNEARNFGKQRLDKVLHPNKTDMTPEIKVCEEVKNYAEQVMQNL